MSKITLTLIMCVGLLTSLHSQNQILGIDTISKPDVKQILHTINNILVSYDDSIDAINDMFIDGDTLHGNGGNIKFKPPNCISKYRYRAE